MCDMTHSYVRHDAFICVTWLVHMCDMTHSYVWHDSLICNTWRIHTCDMTYSYVCHDLFICVIWLNQGADVKSVDGLGRTALHIAARNAVTNETCARVLIDYGAGLCVCVCVCMSMLVRECTCVRVCVFLCTCSCISCHERIVRCFFWLLHLCMYPVGWLRLVGSLKT